jgi:transcriptional regulator with XRE-family HTH domain
MSSDMKTEDDVTVLYDRTRETMGERLRWLRSRNARINRKKDWSLRAIEAQTGITKTRLSQLELDDVEFVRQSEIVQLARLYRVSSDYILGLKATPPYLRGSGASPSADGQLALV